MHAMRRNGFSLLEVALALSVGLALMAAGVYTYQQYVKSAQINKAKLMLAGMRQEISMYRYRTGQYPPIGASYAENATPSLRTNTTDLQPPGSKRFTPFFDLGYQLKPITQEATNNLLVDPLFPPTSTASGSRIFLWGAATGSWGGWEYDPATGRIRPNLPDSVSPGDPPRLW